ncbi:MAG: C25 family peptidase propeptide domain-containing protein, partial [Candidatus Promineifilaceae bacterium]
MFPLSSRSHRRTGRTAAALALLLGAVIFCLQPASADSQARSVAAQLETLPTRLSYTFSAPDYTLDTDDAGQTAITIDGLAAETLPGDPRLPALVYTIAVPPLVDLASVRLEIDAVEQVDLPGRYELPAAAPLQRVQEGPADVDWGPNAATIFDGKNSAVYGHNAFFPAAPLEISNLAHMRKWRLVHLRYSPFSYNPADGRLRLVREVTATLHFDPPQLEGDSLLELQDTLLDDDAMDLVYNAAEARAWYVGVIPDRSSPAAKPGYVIVTTNQVASNISFSAFAAHKGNMGYSVQIITEDDYDSLTGEAPNGRAEKVRKWLQGHYLSDNILYVLLIGDPDPDDP